MHYYGVDHSPSYLWNSATWEISEALIPYLRTVMDGPGGWDRDETIRRAIEIRDGVIQNPEDTVVPAALRRVPAHPDVEPSGKSERGHLRPAAAVPGRPARMPGDAVRHLAHRVRPSGSQSQWLAGGRRDETAIVAARPVPGMQRIRAMVEGVHAVELAPGKRLSQSVAAITRVLSDLA